MHNYYEKFNLSSTSKAEEINDLLQKEYTRVLRKLNNTVGDADKEYKARKELELVEEALQVFKNEETKAAYDVELKKNKKIGKLVDKDSSGGEVVSCGEKINNEPKEDSDLADYIKIQEIIKKKALEEIDSHIKEIKDNSNDSVNKAENYIIRAKQFMDSGKLKEAEAYIDKALDENPKSYSAWELMFFYELMLVRSKLGSYNVDERTYRFPAFLNVDEAKKINYKEVNEGIDNLNKIMQLRSFFSQDKYKVTEVSDKMEDIKIVKGWLDSSGPRKMTEIIANHYKTAYAAGDLKLYMNTGYLYDETRDAYDKIMEYGDNRQKTDFINKAFSTLKSYFNEDFAVVLEDRKKVLEYVEKNLVEEIIDYESRVNVFNKKHNPSAKSSSNVLGIILIYVSLLFSTLYLGVLGVPFLYSVRNVLILPVIFPGLNRLIGNFAMNHNIIAGVITFSIIFVSFYIMLSQKNKLYAKLLHRLFLITSAITIIYFVMAWHMLYLILAGLLGACVVQFITNFSVNDSEFYNNVYKGRSYSTSKIKFYMA